MLVYVCYNSRGMSFDYHLDYSSLDFRKRPELYRVGRGEQGVLLVQPYKREIGQYWRFKTPEIARKSAETIWELFSNYLSDGDFVGADMARKYLQMGWTRARRYANHSSGRKYDQDSGELLPLEEDRWSSPKAKAAAIFYQYYIRARDQPEYKMLKKVWKKVYG